MLKQLENAVLDSAIANQDVDENHVIENIVNVLKAMNEIALTIKIDPRHQPTSPCSSKSSHFDSSNPDDVTIILSPTISPNESPFLGDSCNMILESAPVPFESLTATSPHRKQKPHSKRIILSHSKIIKSGIHKISESQHVVKNKLMELLERKGVLPINDPWKLSDEDSVLRALIAKRWNTTAAMNMMRHISKWRVRENINNIGEILSKKFKHSMERYADCSLYGVDIDGYPILWQDCDEKKLNLLLSEQGISGAVLLNTYIAEKCREAAKFLGVDRYTLVLNMSSISTSILLGNVGSVLRSQIKATQAVYPENMRRCIIYKPPYIFTVIYGVVEQLLEEGVRQKIKVGDNFVKQLIPKKSIPKAFGGEAGWERMKISTETMTHYPVP